MTDKEHMEQSDRELCQLQDALGCPCEMTDEHGAMVDNQKAAMERIRDLIAAEGELGDMKDRAEKAESERDAAMREIGIASKRMAQAEAAASEMRAAIERIRHCIALDYLTEILDHALSTSCGQGWLSPEKVKAVREALERAHGPKPWHIWGGPVDESECSICKALAAVKK